MVDLSGEARAWFAADRRRLGDRTHPEVELLEIRDAAVRCSVGAEHPELVEIATEVAGVAWPGTCSCRRFAREGPCEHLWAALRHLDRMSAGERAAAGLEFRRAARPIPAPPPPESATELVLAQGPDLHRALRDTADPDANIRTAARRGALFASSKDREASRPLRWDATHAFEIEFELDRNEARGAIEVWAELSRTHPCPERLPLRELSHRHGAYLLSRDRRLIRVDRPAVLNLVASLLEDGAIEVPLAKEPQLQQILSRLRQPTDESGSATCTGHMYAEILPGSDCDEEEIGCVLSFVYGEFKLHAGHGNRLFLDGSPDTPGSTPPGVRRDPDQERRILQAFLAAGGSASRDPRDRVQGRVSRSGFAAMVASLIDHAWIVEVNGHRILHVQGQQLRLQADCDWLGLRGGLRFGSQVAPIPALLEAARRHSRLVALPDGGLGLLSEAWLERLRTLQRLSHGSGDELRFQRNQAFVLDALLAARAADELELDEALRMRLRRLRDFAGFKAAAPTDGFRARLRPYQREALGWMQGLAELSLGGCLADDMGLGKTVQVLARLHAHHRGGPGRTAPSLVVAPSSLVFNWQREAARFAPQLRCLVYTGARRAGLRQHFDRCDLILTTYGVLRRDIEILAERTFSYAVLDEAQAIKNHRSLAARSCRLIPAEHRLALSGTPIENHLDELWSLFEFLNPGMLGRAGRLSELQSRRGDPEAAEDSAAALGRALRPFFLRRTKDQVLHELPPKSEQVLYCDLSGRQAQAYAELHRHFQGELRHLLQNREFDAMRMQILEALLRLRQAACSLRLLDPATPEAASAKLDLLVPRLQELGRQGHKALVFSQFVGFLRELRTALDAAGIPCAYLDGSTRDRQAEVDRFQEDQGCTVFLISIKAGGAGLNLTAADYVFLLDPWWNPAVEAQAIDRSHRMGQQRPVTAMRLIARGTIEEKVLQLQERKRSLAAAVFAGRPTALHQLRPEDLAALLDF